MAVAALRFALHPSAPKQAARERQKAAADAAPSPPEPTPESTPAPASEPPPTPAPNPPQKLLENPPERPARRLPTPLRKPPTPPPGADVLAFIKAAHVTKSAEKRYQIVWADQATAVAAEIERRIAVINAEFGRFEPALAARFEAPTKGI